MCKRMHPGTCLSPSGTEHFRGATVLCRGAWSRLLLQVIAQVETDVGCAQATQRLRLDLARALAGHPQHPPDLFKRAALPVQQTRSADR
jgi:hypothetical protein